MRRFVSMAVLWVGLGLSSVPDVRAKTPIPGKPIGAATQCEQAIHEAKTVGTEASMAACVTDCARVPVRKNALRWCMNEHSRLGALAALRAREAAAQAKLDAENRDARAWHAKDVARADRAGKGTPPAPGQQVAPAEPARPALHFVPSGTFKMGSPADEAERDRGEAQFEVILPRPFVMMRTEVTQAQWAQVMGSNPARDPSPDCAVGRVNWYEAVAYANALSKAEGRRACYALRACTGALGGGCPAEKKQGRYCDGAYQCTVQDRYPDCSGYRLPSEAEWEYAARAGSTAAWYGPSGAIAWTEENSSGRVQPVGEKAANAWGLHDMLGNIAEWAADWHGKYPTGRVVDPRGPTVGLGTRVYRGGGVVKSSAEARSASRDHARPVIRSINRGFRLVRRFD